MAKIVYEQWRPGIKALGTVQQANAICADYMARGYTLTLRQLFYQFVSRDLIANTDKEYNRLGEMLNRARLAGLMDWNFMEDRTRNLRGQTHFNSPADVVEAALYSYRLDKWQGQPTRVEVWVEKDALVDVVQRAADTADVNYFSCRGYTSQSEMHAAALRHLRYIKADQRVVVLHLGDHDPSGLQMSEDIEKRLYQFVARHMYDGTSQSLAALDRMYRVKRIALSQEQIAQYNPPPNPAKVTDSRYNWYYDTTGLDESWELDALDPDVLNTLISTEVAALRTNADAYIEVVEREERERKMLRAASQHWPAVANYIATAWPAEVGGLGPRATPDGETVEQGWWFLPDAGHCHYMEEPLDPEYTVFQSTCQLEFNISELREWRPGDDYCPDCALEHSTPDEGEI